MMQCHLISGSHFDKRGRLVPFRAMLLAVGLFAAAGMNGSDCVSDPPMPCQDGGGTTTGGPQVLSDDHVLGDASAPVTVFNYGDFE